MTKSKVSPASGSTLDILAFALRETQSNPQTPTALGTVTGTTGGVQVQFDGESATSGKAYKHLKAYTPTVNDRVLLLQAGHTWVVLGAIV